MKKLLFLLLSVFLCISCSDDNTTTDEPTPNPGEPQIEIPATSLTPNFKSEGGESIIEFTAKSDWSVSVVNTRAESWCSVSPLSGKAGKASLTIRTAANETYDERNATITLRAGTDSKNIIVTQKQKDALLVSSSKVEMKKEGGEFTIEVKANVTFSHSIDEGIDWISAATADTRGLTTTQLKFSVSVNTSVHKREAGITVTDGTLSERITVYQEGEEPQLTATASQQTFGPEGGTLKIEINSNVDYETLLPDASWIAEDQARNQSTHTLYFTISPNETYDNRQADIVFKDKESELADTVRVMQLQKDALIFSDEVIQVPGEENRLKIRFRRNIDFKVDVTANWITQVDNPETRSLQTDSVYFVILANPDYESERTCQIIFSSLDEKIEQRITIVQEAGMPEESEDEKELRWVLEKIYHDANGDNWHEDDKRNWCSNKPVVTWAGIIKHGEYYTVQIASRSATGFIEIPHCRLLQEFSFDQEFTTSLDIQPIKVESISISDCPNLKRISCQTRLQGQQGLIKRININNCQQLLMLDCYNNSIENISVTDCPNLSSINCQNNSLKTLPIITNCSSINDIQCGNNLIEGSVVFINNPTLETISLYNNNINKLNFSGCEALKNIHYDIDKIEEIDFSYTGIESFQLEEYHHAPLKTLLLRGCKNLQFVEIKKTDIENIVISECPYIYKIICNENKLLTSLEMENIAQGYNYECGNNISDNPLLVNLKIGNSNIRELWCNGNKALKHLDINDNIYIENIYCFSNGLTELNLSNLEKLKTIHCYSNKLTSINITNCNNTYAIKCSDNELEFLDVSHLNKLYSLECNNNKLTDILIPSNLYSLNCCQNKIKKEVPASFKDIFGESSYEWEQRFQHDPLYYDYGYVYDSNGNIVLDPNGFPIKKWKENNYGWYFPGEPEKGYHGW